MARVLTLYYILSTIDLYSSTRARGQSMHSVQHPLNKVDSIIHHIYAASYARRSNSIIWRTRVSGTNRGARRSIRRNIRVQRRIDGAFGFIRFRVNVVRANALPQYRIRRRARRHSAREKREIRVSVRVSSRRR